MLEVRFDGCDQSGEGEVSRGGYEGGFEEEDLMTFCEAGERTKESRRCLKREGEKEMEEVGERVRQRDQRSSQASSNAPDIPSVQSNTRI